LEGYTAVLLGTNSHVVKHVTKNSTFRKFKTAPGRHFKIRYTYYRHISRNNIQTYRVGQRKWGQLTFCW